MLVYTNGDSWTYGDEIDLDPNYDPAIGINKYSFGGQIATKLNAEHINQGLCGGSNYRIIRTTCDFIIDYPTDRYGDLIVIIGWTNVDRLELYVDDSIDVQSSWYKLNISEPECAKKIVTADKETINDIIEYQKLYVRSVHSQYANMVTYFHQKFMLANMLENLGIKYYFFDALSGAWDIKPKELDDFYNKEYKKITTPYMKTDVSMAGYCYTNGYPIAPGNHAMIDGHTAWAEVLYTQLIESYPEII